MAPLVGTGFAITIAANLELGDFTTDEAAIAAICEALLSGEINFGAFVSELAQFASELTPATVGEIVSCLAQIL